MQIFLTILVILAAIGAVAALVRGIIIFLKTSHEDIASGGASASGLRQNKMMRSRIMFQALAVIFAILLMLLSRS